MRTMSTLSLAIATLLTLAVVPPAQARDYVVHSCRTPAGLTAPTDGWETTGSSGYSWFANGCSGGGAMQAGLFGNSQPANLSNVGWGFASGPAPIRAYRIERRGEVHDASHSASMLLFSADSENTASGGHHVDYCAFYAGCSGISGLLVRALPAIPENSHSWYLTVGCGGSPGAFCALAPGRTDFGSLAISAATFTLDDSEQPTASRAEGSLTAVDAVAGDLTFVASDGVSGVRRATIEVDGREVVSVVPDDNRGHCAEVGQAGALPDFLYRRPCPERVQVEIALPAGLLAPGTHTLRARVFDAAGNAVTAFGPRQVEVKVEAVRELAPASLSPDGPLNPRASYGRRLRVSGVLRAGTGRPLPGEPVELTMTATAARRAVLRKTLVTDAAGRYEFWVKATASRRLALGHKASGASLEQRLTVRSAIRLRALRSRVAPLGRMRLSGRIQTERTRRGAAVAIKVLSSGRWRTVGIVRSDTRGRFAFSYRFRRTRHARFVFRAVALASGDLAVKAKPSNSVRIRVGR